MTVTENPIRNGVDTATLFATLDAVKAAPEAANFQFRAGNAWISGTHSRSIIDGFFGSAGDDAQAAVHIGPITPRAVGPDNGPCRSSSSCALAACLTAGIATVAPPGRAPHVGRVNRRGRLTCSALGLSDDVRNGYGRCGSASPPQTTPRSAPSSSSPAAVGRLRRPDQRRPVAIAVDAG
jgi:hypothetical protein